MADRWSQLPDHLLNLITKRLELETLIRFNSVCHTWKSISSPLLPPTLNPWLIVPYGNYTSKDNSTICDQTLGLFNLSNRHTYKLSTPQLTDRRIIGSCKGGWLITLHENGEIQVFHPFSKTLINLPPVNKLPGVTGKFIDDDNDLVYEIPDHGHKRNIVASCIREFYICKAVMSTSNPRASIVIIIHGLSRNLAFCRLGKDKTWRCMEGDNGSFSDVTFYRGRFYAVNNTGNVFVVYGFESSPVIKFVIAPRYGYILYKHYLVESFGELFMVQRNRFEPSSGFESTEEEPVPYRTDTFVVSKMVDCNGLKWVEVDDLSIHCALFIGFNDSFSLLTSDMPGYKGNSIYFTDDNYEEYMEQPFGGHDNGVFGLTYAYVDKFYPNDSKLIKPPPVWFTTYSDFMVERWPQLPENLLGLITKRLELESLIRFSCVCRAWKSFSSSLLPPKLNPWLIVPYGGYISNNGSTICDNTLGFFNLSNCNVYKVETSQIADRRICGSCRGGWLITLHENGEIQLFHPFSKVVIDLPPITELPGVAGSFVDEDNDLVYNIHTGVGNEEHRDNIISTCIREFYVCKAVMSSDNPQTSILMAIQGLSRYLAFCRPGRDKTWSSVKGDNGRFSDITFYKGKFYAVNSSGHVFVVDGLKAAPPFIKLVITPRSEYLLYKHYLVVSFGEMFMVQRNRYEPSSGFDFMEEDHVSYKTNNFIVNKLDRNGPKWVKVDDLGTDRALFVGCNDSFSLLTSDLPGYKGNSIYFTDDNYEEYMEQPFGGHDHGVFDFKYAYVEKFYPNDSKLLKPPPVWFTTNSC